MDDARPPTPGRPDPNRPGRRSPATRPWRCSSVASELLASGDFADAGAHFQRVVGLRRPGDHGRGPARPRRGALPAQRRGRRPSGRGHAVLELPETPSTYTAWRNVAAARVRDGDLTGAIEAYREADRRAPREDKAEIANRLGWLTKETGDARASQALFRQGPRRLPAAHAHPADHRGDDASSR